jgi:hypothetical protein
MLHAICLGRFSSDGQYYMHDPTSILLRRISCQCGKMLHAIRLKFSPTTLHTYGHSRHPTVVAFMNGKCSHSSKTMQLCGAMLHVVPLGRISSDGQRYGTIVALSTRTDSS